MSDLEDQDQPKRKYRHPIYQVQLPPEELPVFEAILGQYLSEVEDPTVTDRFAIVRVAMVETKLRRALENGDPPDSVDVLSKLLHRELESLKVTRKTKDGKKSTGNTPAEWASAIMRGVDAQQTADARPGKTAAPVGDPPASEPDAPLSGDDDWSKPKRGRPRKEPLAVVDEEAPTTKARGKAAPAPEPVDDFGDLSSFFE